MFFLAQLIIKFNKKKMSHKCRAAQNKRNAYYFWSYRAIK